MRNQDELAPDLQAGCAPGRSLLFLNTREIVIASFIIATFGLFLRGYFFGEVNHLGQLLLIARHMDPSYLANDFAVNANDGFHVRYYYAKSMAALGTVAPLPIVFLIVTWLCNAMIALVTTLAARDIFKSDLTALFAAAFAISVEAFYIGGASFIAYQYLVSGLPSLPFAFLALWAAIRCRPFLLAAATMPAIAFHPLLGLEVAALGLGAMGLTFLIGLDPGRRNRERRSNLAGLIGIAASGLMILGFYYIAWMLPESGSDSIGASTYAVDAFEEILAGFLDPGHYLPSHMGLFSHLLLGLFVAATLISWKWWRDRPDTDADLARRVLLLIAVTLASVACGFVFVELIPMRIWLAAQTYRMLFIVKWLGFMLMAATAARLVTGGNRLSALNGWLMLGSGGVMALQPVVALWGHVLEAVRRRLEPTALRRLLPVLMGVGFLAAVAFWWKLGSIRALVPTAACLAVGFWYWSTPRGGRLRNLVPALAVLLFLLTLVADRHIETPFFSKAFAPNRPMVFLSDYNDSETEIARFIRDNTAPDVIVLTPPLGGRIRLRAQRAIVVSSRPGVSIPAMGEWLQRLSDCYGEVQSIGYAASADLTRLYRQTDDRRVLACARKYNAVYAVLFAETPTRLPVLFSNEDYKLVKIDPSD